MFRISVRAVSAHALALAAALPAFAQEAGPSGPSPAPAPALIEDEERVDTVIVVGQTDAPITVVPRGLSVSLGEEQFDAINAVNAEDLMKYAPNFFIRKR